MFFFNKDTNGPQTGKRVIHAVIMIVFMFFIQLFTTMVISTVVLKNDPELAETINAASKNGDNGPFNDLLKSCTLLGTVIAGLISILPYIIRDVKTKSYCVAYIKPWLIPVLLSAGVVLNAISTGIINLIDESTPATVDTIRSSDPWLAVLSIGIVTPVVEEMFFRRTIINALRDRNEPIAAIASAVVFAMFHSGTIQMTYAFLFGLMFAFIYVKTGNLAYSILLHIAINTSSTLYALGGESASGFVIPVVAVCSAIIIAGGVILFGKTRRRA